LGGTHDIRRSPLQGDYLGDAYPGLKPWAVFSDPPGGSTNGSPRSELSILPRRRAEHDFGVIGINNDRPFWGSSLLAGSEIGCEVRQKQTDRSVADLLRGFPIGLLERPIWPRETLKIQISDYNARQRRRKIGFHLEIMNFVGIKTNGLVVEVPTR
jgi:hypothetical protein